MLADNALDSKSLKSQPLFHFRQKWLRKEIFPSQISQLSAEWISPQIITQGWKLCASLRISLRTHTASCSASFFSFKRFSEGRGIIRWKVFHLRQHGIWPPNRATQSSCVFRLVPAF